MLNPISWLHKVVFVKSRQDQRDQFSVTRMCRQLGVSVTGYCQWRTRALGDRSMANAALDAQVAAIHGYCQIQIGFQDSYRYLIHDRDCIYEKRLDESMTSMGLDYHARQSRVLRHLPAVLPKSESRPRLAEGAFVLAKSVLGGLHHEYSLAMASTSA